MHKLIAATMTLILTLAANTLLADHHGEATEEVVQQTVCPVSNEPIDKSVTAMGPDGQTVYLCCKKCRSKFKKSPEKFVAKLSKDDSVAALYDVGCGGCIFGMNDVKGCKTAIKIDGKAYLVEGGGINAHKSGLCKASRKAKVIGKLDGDVFKADSIELVTPPKKKNYEGSNKTEGSHRH